MRRRRVGAGVALVLAAGAAAPAVPCETPVSVYIPIEAVTALLGLRGETRGQYLDRRYGTWRAAEPGLLELAAPPAGAALLPVRVPRRPALRVERLDIVVEARLELIDAGGRSTWGYGHREIGGFALEPDTGAELSVPLAALREHGAVLVIATVRRAPGFDASEVQVAAVDVERPGCERRRYVPDRATAIRLNRTAASPP